MKCGWLFVLLLALVSSYVCQAQNNRPPPDRVQIAVTQAMREGRITDAEKLLTDAIRELEQSDPESLRLADYLKQLSMFLERRGRHTEALALSERASEIERNAYGPSDLRLAPELTTQASRAQAAGDNRQAELLLNQALQIVHTNTTNLNSSLNIDLAAGVYSSFAIFYISEHRWADAEKMMQEEAKLCNFFQEPYRAGYANCGSLNERLAEVYRAEGKTTEAEQLHQDETVPAELDALNRIAERLSLIHI